MADTGEVKHHVVTTEKAGKFNVWVEGELDHMDKKPVILTIHDMGSNHKAWFGFVNHPNMLEVKSRVIYIHVDVPGQEDGSEDLPSDFQFPSMQDLGESIVEILDKYKIKYCIGLGEGAGANILARFAMAHPKRCMGLCLIHCTCTKAGVMEYFRDKVINWRLESGMNPTAEEYLVFHKFGNQIEKAENKEAKEKLIHDYAENLKKFINPRNLRLYVNSFRQRKEMAKRLEKELTCDCLLVTGAKASHLHTVFTMQNNMRKDKTSFLKVDNVGDVLTEAPSQLATSFILFLKGCGLLSTLLMPGQTRRESFGRARSMSMEDYDKPRRRGSTSSTTPDSPSVPNAPPTVPE